MKTVMYLAALTFVLSSTGYADQIGNSPMRVGAYARGDDFRAKQMKKISRQKHSHRTELVNEVILKPVTVRGKDGITVVSGVRAVNISRILQVGPQNTASLLEVQCPERGNRIIVRSSQFRNEGDITEVGGGSAALLVQKCSPGRVVNVDVLNGTFVNNGSIRAN